MRTIINFIPKLLRCVNDVNTEYHDGEILSLITTVPQTVSSLIVLAIMGAPLHITRISEVEHPGPDGLY